MSFAQLIKDDKSDYYTNLYDQNKTAQYLKSGNRILKVTGTPVVGETLLVQSVNAGTYASPDIVEFAPVFGPGGIDESIAVQFGPAAPSAIGLNPTAVLNSMPVDYNTGFTYQAPQGRILQTFGQDKLYFVDASVSFVLNNTQALGEVLVSLYLYDVDLAAAALLGTSYVVMQPFATATTRGVNISAQVNGRPNPNSYFYIQLDATNGALPLNIGVSFVRLAVTAV